MVISNVHAAFAAGVSRRDKREEERFCRECGLCVAIICNPSPTNSFLIGSHGLTIVPSGKAKGSWLPIAHDVAVSVTSFPDRELLVVIDDKAQHVVEAINAATNALSHTIASRSGNWPGRLLYAENRPITVAIRCRQLGAGAGRTARLPRRSSHLRTCLTTLPAPAGGGRRGCHGTRRLTAARRGGAVPLGGATWASGQAVTPNVGACPPGRGGRPPTRWPSQPSACRSSRLARATCAFR